MSSQQPTDHAKQRAPDYFNPHNVVQDERPEVYPLLAREPIPEDPREALARKYPVKVIAGVIILVVTVLAIPVGVYLNLRPTRVFIEATASPSPTPTPTPTGTPAPASNVEEFSQN